MKRCPFSKLQCNCPGDTCELFSSDDKCAYVNSKESAAASKSFKKLPKTELTPFKPKYIQKRRSGKK